jgi:phage gp37-like protein
MPLPSQFDLERLKVLHEQAHATLEAADKETTEQQRTIAKDATSHFEKIAGFCGAAIIVVVSFLGGHKDAPMQWHIIIPISIWILVAGMVAATTRNFIYASWAHRSYQRSAAQARKDELDARIAVMEATPNITSLQSGERFSKADIDEMKTASAEVGEELAKSEKKENSMMNQWIFLGRLAQSLAVVGIACLAILATKNV